MPQTELTEKVLEQVAYELADTGTGAYLYPRYSGRGMFGAHCLGVVGHPADLIAFTLLLREAVTDLEGENRWDFDVRPALEHTEQDSMHPSSIFYFRELSAPEGWEPEDYS